MPPADTPDVEVATPEELTRQLEALREHQHEQATELAALRNTLQTLDGRTRRHELGQDAIGELQQAISELAQRFDQDASLRRDLGGALERSIEHERAERRTVAGALDELVQRLLELERNTGVDASERRSLTERVGQRDQREDLSVERLAAVELHEAATREALQRLAADLAAASTALPALAAAYDELDTRTRDTQLEQRRAADAVSALASERQRETELLEVIGQQRATRQRLEQRLIDVEEGLEAARRVLADTAEERAMLRQQLAGAEQRLLLLRETFEAQRVAVVEHLGLLTRAAEESDRRSVEEIERSARRARDLLVRFTERSEEVSREQPL